METINTKEISIKHGVIAGLITVIYSLILQITQLADNKFLSWLGYIILISIIIITIKKIKSENEGFISFKKGFTVSYIISIISGIMSSIFMYIYLEFVDNSMIETIKNQQIIEFEKQGMSEEQIEQALEISSYFLSPISMLLIGIVGTFFMGAIISAVISAIMKNEKPIFNN